MFLLGIVLLKTVVFRSLCNIRLALCWFDGSGGRVCRGNVGVRVVQGMLVAPGVAGMVGVHDMSGKFDMPGMLDMSGIHDMPDMLDMTDNFCGRRIGIYAG